MGAELIEILTIIIHKTGILGILISTGLEYACFPVSSEILLPFIGYSIFRGGGSLLAAIAVSTLGAMLGCSFCYFVGKFSGYYIETILCKKWKSLDAGLKHANEFFKRYGPQSVMIGRIFPIVRTYISFPAGMANMEYSYFLFYTTLGALLWNTVLISLGFLLGEHWESVTLFFKENNRYFTILLLVILAALVWKIYQKRKSPSLFASRMNGNIDRKKKR